ncbi:hypothetical protein AB0J52_34625, partial [Spirillospora sp. NPDC049652]
WTLDVAVQPEDAVVNGQAPVPGVPLGDAALRAFEPVLAAMPLRHRLPLLLADAEGCTEDEAAWLLGLTRADFLVLLHGGRTALHAASPVPRQADVTPGGSAPDGLSDRGRSRLLTAFRGVRL